MGFDMSDHQTEMFDPISAKGWRETPPGMAHWLGAIGSYRPVARKICGECLRLA